MTTVNLRTRLEHFLTHWKSALSLFCFCFGIALISQLPGLRILPILEVGDISPKNIKATMDLRAVDDVQTEKTRESMIAAVPDVYDFDSQLFQTLDQRLHDAKAIALTDKSQLRVEQLLRIKLTPREWSALTKSKGAEALAQAWRSFQSENSNLWVFRDYPRGAAIIRDISSGQEISASRSQLESQSRLLASVKTDVMSRLVSHPQAAILNAVLGKILTENVTPNPLETTARKEEAKRKVESSYHDVKQGEMIIREGQRVERRHSLLLRSMADLDHSGFDLKQAALFSALLGFLVLVLFFVGRRNFRKFKMTLRDEIVTGAFILISCLFLASLQLLFISAKGDVAVAELLWLLLPIGFTGMTLRLFTSMEITTFSILIQSVTIAWIFQNPYYGLMMLAAALAGAARMRRISVRRDVFKAGFISGLVMAAFASIGIALNLLPDPGLQSPFLTVFLTVLFCLLSGLVSAGMVLAIQPLLETLGYTTDLRLMELASDHPLLHDLMLKAPGTYFHSYIVSQLAEKAAEAVHANGLFARVASLYHDVGKARKPHYFIENIKGENKHDKLAPTMSALIISNHVKDGIEIAMEHKLPLSIVEIIPQHHGTSLISYFYEKAKRSSESDADSNVNEKDFRYAGPKPQTKEAAIILMADAVEATAKSMMNATEDQLRQMVHQTVQRFFLDGQLDECELSLKDLSAIGNAFLQVLQGVYHHRIDYPHLKDKDGKDVTVTFPKFKTNPSA